MKQIIFVAMLFSILYTGSISIAYAGTEPIAISYSEDRENVIFDGKWTNRLEWKQSSLNQYDFPDGTKFILRTAHHGDFIYIFIDAVSDIKPDHGTDKAIVCFDANNDKTSQAGKDDYCFGATLGNKDGFVLQGGSPLAISNHFKKIPNPDGFIGISTVSDENDRYSKVPHSSYEFRIPIQLLDRSDNYGFYVTVYDDATKTFNSWPKVNPEKPLRIPSPSEWGEIYSPDKSIPEFHFLLLILFSSLFLVVFLTRMRKIPALYRVKLS